MIEIQRIFTADANYGFVESLLESAFPADERRDTYQQREFTDNNESFKANVILFNGSPIGLMNYWDLGAVYYIEHFAISQSSRNGGFGEKSLSLIKNMLADKPIILEVELPVGDIERRRIGFYERNGFVLSGIEYKQPPYRKDGGCLDMNIMSYNLRQDTNLCEAVKELYKQVYSYISVS